MKIYIIDGPNMNMLGIREPKIYGSITYLQLKKELAKEAKKHNVSLVFKQSNCEGKIIDFIQEAYFKKANGILINPAAYTTTSIGILDAIKACNIPTIEIHVSNINKRETFRKNSLIKPIAIKSIIGHGWKGYIEGLEYLVQYLEKKNGK